MVPLGIRCFRYPRSVGSIFIMPSIGANFFGKARGACGNLLEKQFPLFLYALFLLPKCLSSFFIHALQFELIVARWFLSRKYLSPFHIFHIHIYWEEGEIFSHTSLSDSFFRPIDYFSNNYVVLGIEFSAGMIWNERKIRYRDLHLRKGSRSHYRKTEFNGWKETFQGQRDY